MSESVPLISIKNLSKSYRLGEVEVPALKGVSLDVARGEFVAIMGASGSGKSTLLNILGCLDQATSGEYWLDEREVNRLDADTLAQLRNQKIGFVFQNFNLLPRTSAIENVELPLHYGPFMQNAEKRQKALELLTRLGMGERIHHHPSQLSGGQQQRVAIARALVTRPSLILADEPTGNLDSRSGGEIMNLFRELNAEGITLIMVTHENDIAGWADRTIHVKDGLLS